MAIVYVRARGNDCSWFSFPKSSKLHLHGSKVMTELWAQMFPSCSVGPKNPPEAQVSDCVSRWLPFHKHHCVFSNSSAAAVESNTTGQGHAGHYVVGVTVACVVQPTPLCVIPPYHFLFTLLALFCRTISVVHVHIASFPNTSSQHHRSLESVSGLTIWEMNFSFNWEGEIILYAFFNICQNIPTILRQILTDIKPSDKSCWTTY